MRRSGSGGPSEIRLPLLSSPPEGFKRPRGQEQPQENRREIKNQILGIDDALREWLEVGKDGAVGHRLRPPRIVITADPTQHPQKQADRKSGRARDDLVAGGG